jgi:hypothetical protein
VRGDRETTWQILAYPVGLVAATLVPVVLLLFAAIAVDAVARRFELEHCSDAARLTTPPKRTPRRSSFARAF